MTALPLILIVEDEVKIANALAVYLRDAGYSTGHILDGLEVVPYVRLHQPQLILLDVSIPGRSGIEVCRDLRTFSVVPIIMITALVQEVDLLSGLSVGADDYMCKPFSPREVVARVKAVLRRAPDGRATLPHGNQAAPHPTTGESATARLLIVGVFAVDDERMRITLRGAPLEITPTEFKLLRRLLRTPGRVFSRALLLEEIHGQDALAFDRAIDSHIKNIRKRLGPDSRMLRSIYGVGYQLNPEVPYNPDDP
jgi:two-component system, OmpR family, response regulator BaeR